MTTAASIGIPGSTWEKDGSSLKAQRGQSLLCHFAVYEFLRIFAVSDTRGYSTRHTGVRLGCPLLFADYTFNNLIIIVL